MDYPDGLHEEDWKTKIWNGYDEISLKTLYKNPQIDKMVV